MFLNRNYFKKNNVTFKTGDTFLVNNGVRRDFSSITACYQSSIEHLCNGVYEGHLQILKLSFVDQQGVETYEVDSNHKESYGKLQILTLSVGQWRQKQLEKQYDRNKKLVFPILSTQTSIQLDKNMISLNGVEVKALYLNSKGDNPYIEFDLGQSQKCFATGSISDVMSFIHFASQIMPIGTKSPAKIKKYLNFAFYGSVISLGLNGWFNFYSTNKIIDAMSVFSGIILSVWLIVCPFFLLVKRSNAKKMANTRKLSIVPHLEKLIGGEDDKAFTETTTVTLSATKKIYLVDDCAKAFRKILEEEGWQLTGQCGQAGAFVWFTDYDVTRGGGHFKISTIDHYASITYSIVLSKEQFAYFLPKFVKNNICYTTFDDVWEYETRCSLFEKIKKGKELKFEIFSESSSPLSQRYKTEFKDLDGKVYNSSEQYTMACKARLFADIVAFEKIMTETDVARVKQLGRGVTNFNQDIWDANKVNIIRKANKLKFHADSTFRQALMATKDRIIVEANPNDLVYSAGLSPDDKDLENPLMWKGENILGFVLMNIREQISYNCKLREEENLQYTSPILSTPDNLQLEVSLHYPYIIFSEIIDSEDKGEITRLHDVSRHEVVNFHGFQIQFEENGNSIICHENDEKYEVFQEHLHLLTSQNRAEMFAILRQISTIINNKQVNHVYPNTMAIGGKNNDVALFLKNLTINLFDYDLIYHHCEHRSEEISVYKA